MLIRYIGFLRAVNVGKRKVPMAQLRARLEAMGLLRVSTFLASGNVFFDAREGFDAAEIEAALKDEFGFEVPVLLRTVRDVERLIAQNPFAAIDPSPSERWVVTFCSSAISEADLVPHDQVRVVGLVGNEVCSVLDLAGGDFPGYGAVHEKRQGVVATSRFYPTLVRILEAAQKS